MKVLEIGRRKRTKRSSTFLFRKKIAHLYFIKTFRADCPSSVLHNKEREKNYMYIATYIREIKHKSLEKLRKLYLKN